MKYLFVIVILLVLSVPAFAQSNPVHDALVDRPAYYVTTGCNEVAGTMLPEIALMFQRLVAFMMPDAAQMHVMEIGIPSANNGLSTELCRIQPMSFCRSCSAAGRSIGSMRRKHCSKRRRSSCFFSSSSCSSYTRRGNEREAP